MVFDAPSPHTTIPLMPARLCVGVNRRTFVTGVITFSLPFVRSGTYAPMNGVVTLKRKPPAIHARFTYRFLHAVPHVTIRGRDAPMPSAQYRAFYARAFSCAPAIRTACAFSRIFNGPRCAVLQIDCVWFCHSLFIHHSWTHNARAFAIYTTHSGKGISQMDLFLPHCGFISVQILSSFLFSHTVGLCLSRPRAQQFFSNARFAAREVDTPSRIRFLDAVLLPLYGLGAGRTVVTP